MKWEIAKLGDLATFINGYPFKPSEWASSGMEIIRIQNLTKSGGESNYFQGTIPSKYKVIKGDILISWSATLDIFEWNGSEAWLNQHIFKVQFDKIDIDKLYFKFLIKYILEDLKKQVHGATMQHITKGKFDNMPVPLPPLATQKRIAEILDKADALRQKDQALLRKYDELAQAVFVDMFGDPVRNEKGWEVGSIRDIALEVKYGTSSPAQKAGKFPYLRMNNLTYSGDWDFKDLKFISLPENEKEKYVLKNHDLVFNRTNSKELVGKTAVYQGHEEMVIAGYLIRVRFTDKGNPFFVSGCLNSKFGKSILLNMCKSIIGMANINAQELQDIQIPIPPMSIQNEYERRLKSIKMNKKVVEKSKNHSESLFQALLQKAFTGELVP